MKYWLVKYLDKVVALATTKEQANHLCAHFQAQFACQTARGGWFVVEGEDGVQYTAEGIFDCGPCG